MSYYGQDGGWLTDNVEFTVEFTVREDDNDMYEVSLPHQCDDYGITCRKDKSAAIADLRALIADAREAIKRLEMLEGEPA